MDNNIIFGILVLGIIVISGCELFQEGDPQLSRQLQVPSGEGGGLVFPDPICGNRVIERGEECESYRDCKVGYKCDASCLCEQVLVGP